MTLSLVPYIITNGNGREAVEFYKKVFGAEVKNMQTFGEAHQDPNDPIPDDAKDKIMHAHLQIDNSELMISDTYPGQPYTIGDQLSLAIVLSDIERAKRIFEGLSEGGKVEMPLQETFWSPLYGQVIDQFGVLWQVSTEGNNK